MTWGSPTWGFALLGLLGLVILAIVSTRRHIAKLKQAIGVHLFDKILPKSVVRRRIVRDGLFLIGLMFTIIALADPRFREQLVKVDVSGVDMMLVVDLSSSMNARDVDPSRLERVRREIDDLLEVSRGDRIGLVIYAGGAYGRLPLTADTEIVRLITSELETEIFQSQGSALGEGLRTALKLLGEPKQTGQAIVVLSDGEVHDPTDAVAAAEEAVKRHVPIYAVGIGERASPIPQRDGSYLTDSSGATVETRPDETVLKDIARQSGGAFVRSTAGREDIASLYAEIRQSVDGTQRKGTLRRVSESGYGIPLSVGIIAMIIASWWGDGRRFDTRWLSAVILLGVVTARAGVPEADQAFRDRKFDAAIEELEQTIAQQPNDAEAWSRLGTARYRAGDPEGAIRAWRQQQQIEGNHPDLDFNIGNAQYQARRLDEAAESYQRALESDSSHPGASKNLKIVQKELEARKQSPPPSSSESGESGDSPPSSGETGSAPPGKGSESSSSDSAAGASAQAEGPPKSTGPSGGQSSENSGSAGTSPTGTPGEKPSTGDKTAKNTGGEGGPNSPSSTTGDPTAAQAEALLDSVEEGRPRVVVPGQSTSDRPW